MNTNEKVSIIVPLYNTKEYIDRCIESLVNQSYKDLEVLVIDDNSSDGGGEIVNNYIKNNNYIKYIFLGKNSGVGNARNVGITNASGKYITFVDSDDWIDSDFIMCLVNSLKSSDAEIAIAGIIDDYDYYKNYTKRYSYNYENEITNKYALNILCKSFNNDIYITPMVCSKLYRTDFIKKNNLKFDKRSYYEDDIYTFKSFILAKHIKIVPNIFYHYYQRNSSITHTFSNKHIDDLSDAFIMLKEYIYYNKLETDYETILNDYFQRTLQAMVGRLLSSDEDSISIKNYFKHMSKVFLTEDNIFKVIDYLDMQRLKHFFDI